METWLIISLLMIFIFFGLLIAYFAFRFSLQNSNVETDENITEITHPNVAPLSMTPFQIHIDIEGELTKNNIRLNMPTLLTIGVSDKHEIYQNAERHLSGLSPSQIENSAREIIHRQLCLVIRMMNIEEICHDRAQLLNNIFQFVSSELSKIGLCIINIKILEMTDDADYIKTYREREQK